MFYSNSSNDDNDDVADDARNGCCVPGQLFGHEFYRKITKET